MPADPRQHGLARRDPGSGALMRLRDDGGDGLPPNRLFCASPTVLQAINQVLAHRGMPTLCVLPDGTIGPTDPLTFRVEYLPSPFVL
jgi:hypothetical protein